MYGEKLAKLLAHLMKSFDKPVKTDVVKNFHSHSLSEAEYKELYLALIKVMIKLEIMKFNQAHV